MPWIVLAFSWSAPWVFFVITANDKSGHVPRAWTASALFLAVNFLLLYAVFLHRDFPMAPWVVAVGFMFTFLALLGAYASADYAASHQIVMHNHHRELASCYTSASDKTVALHPIDAIYFTLSTVTTAGFGDIAPHSGLCRALTSAQLAIGFPMLGLSFAGVAARLFKEL